MNNLIIYHLHYRQSEGSVDTIGMSREGSVRFKLYNSRAADVLKII